MEVPAFVVNYYVGSDAHAALGRCQVDHEAPVLILDDAPITMAPDGGAE